MSTLPAIIEMLTRRGWLRPGDNAQSQFDEMVDIHELDEFIVEVEQRFGVQLTDEQVEEIGTVEDLATAVDAQIGSTKAEE